MRENRSLGSARGAPGNGRPYRKRVERDAVNLLPKTCGQPECHPGMPDRIASARVHRDVTKTSSGAPYYVQKILFWIVIASVLVTGLWFIPELLRRVKGKRPS